MGAEMSIEAMKQALEALKRADKISGYPNNKQTITALRQAIKEASENGLYREGYRNGYGFGEAAGKQKAIADAEKQEPVAWATREDFFRELDRSVNRMRQQMTIKSVVMRCADYDLALPVIDFREGHVLVGQVFTPMKQALEKAQQEEREALEVELLKLKQGVAANSDYIQGRWDLIGEFQDIIRARGEK
jgi:hypothetical protein